MCMLGYACVHVFSCSSVFVCVFIFECYGVVVRLGVWEGGVICVFAKKVCMKLMGQSAVICFILLLLLSLSSSFSDGYGFVQHLC